MAKYMKALVGRDENFLVIITDALSAVKTMSEIHRTSPAGSCAAGRLLIGTKLMELALKDEGSRLSVEIRGGGETGKIVAYADKYGTLKVKIHNPTPTTRLKKDGKIDVAHAVGSEGFIVVTKDSLRTQPFTGTARLVSGEIAEDIASYYVVSEQQATAISLGVFVSEHADVVVAGGLMLHVLPDAKEKEITKIEALMLEAKPISTYLRMTTDLKDILKMIFKDEPIKVIDEGRYDYSCDCSRERAQRVLASISQTERQSIIETDGSISLHCDYCQRDFVFSEDEV